jgi:hypothetical protein
MDKPEQELCMMCGEYNSGHVLVRMINPSRRDNTIVGRVCSSHTLKEVQLHKSEKFSVKVLFDPLGGE